MTRPFKELPGQPGVVRPVLSVRAASWLVPLELELDGFRWSAPVTFCDPWPFGFHLLGQEGFLRYFVVRFRASVPAFEVEPDEGDPEPLAFHGA